MTECTLNALAFLFLPRITTNQYVCVTVCVRNQHDLLTKANLVSLSACLSVCLSACLSVWVFVRLSVWLYVGEFDVFRFDYDTCLSLRPNRIYPINFDWSEECLYYWHFCCFCVFSQDFTIISDKDNEKSKFIFQLDFCCIGNSIFFKKNIGLYTYLY